MSRNHSNNTTNGEHLPILDALIVGAGFSGLYLLDKLRENNFTSVKLYEASSGPGGVWEMNSYPGARVDSDYPIYQLAPEKFWKDFEFNERFPGYQEIQRYFRHVEKQLNLSGNEIEYNTKVVGGEFNGQYWIVSTEDGRKTYCRYLLLCIGFAAKTYSPNFKGLETFNGVCHHTAAWPKSGVDLYGKRVAVIGTGASGVQVIQEIGPIVSHLTVYQRTPNLALPMRQEFRTNQSHKDKFPSKTEYKKIMQNARYNNGGFTWNIIHSNAADATPEARERVFEDLWARGELSFGFGNYEDSLVEKRVNDWLYEFWCKKTRARINDPVKKDLLAPLIPPHAIGTKRPSLEQRYYEVFNQPNVDIVDTNVSPILEVTPHGIRTKDGLVELDVIILATGFDSVTGGMLNISLKNEHGLTLQDKWSKGTWTYLGMSVADFPNLFYTYGAQAPTAFANGPTCAQIQDDWITELMVYMRSNGKTKINAKKSAEAEWRKIVLQIWNSTLFPNTRSWYQGSNIPGKPIEPLNYPGGLPKYIEALEKCRDNGYEDFNIE